MNNYEYIINEYLASLTASIRKSKYEDKHLTLLRTGNVRMLMFSITIHTHSKIHVLLWGKDISLGHESTIQC